MSQGIQEKKSSNKFNCRVCNEKQSVKRVFASHDSGKEIRLITQKLNMDQGERRSAPESSTKGLFNAEIKLSRRRNPCFEF
jgi:hypothetical protein